MTRAEFNELARAAATSVPLGGTRREGPAPGLHHWKVRLEPADEPRTWRVFVGAGAVNERIAGITYRRTGDPRGFDLSPDDPRLAALESLYGPGFAFYDRLLTERDPPFLLLTAPLSFQRITDPARRPRALRSAADWEKELWMASVWVSALPFKADPALGTFPPQTTAPNQPLRYRVGAGVMATATVGTASGGARELARLWLLRDPQDAAGDEIRVEQREFWSLRAMALQPFLDLGLGPDQFGTQLGGIENFPALVIGLAVDQINALLSGLGGIRWWTV